MSQASLEHGYVTEAAKGDPETVGGQAARERGP